MDSIDLDSLSTSKLHPFGRALLKNKILIPAVDSFIITLNGDKYNPFFLQKEEWADLEEYWSERGFNQKCNMLPVLRVTDPEDNQQYMVCGEIKVPSKPFVSNEHNYRFLFNLVNS